MFNAKGRDSQRVPGLTRRSGHDDIQIPGGDEFEGDLAPDHRSPIGIQGKLAYAHLTTAETQCKATNV